MTFFVHQANIFAFFPSLSKYFSFIKKVSHKKTFFLYHQNSWNFPQGNIFPLSRKFSTKKALFLHQKSFPSSRTFSSSRKFSFIKEVQHRQIFSFIKEIFHKQIFLFIKEVFYKQIFFMIINVFSKLNIKILRKNILTRLVVKRSYIFNPNNKLFSCRFA